MKSANSVFAGLGTTIFSVMSQLARDCGAVNLGQGFPDTNGPEDVRQHAATYLEDRPNQYPPMFGVPELREAVAAHNKRFYGLDIDPMTETLITSGATEALACCFFGLIEPGDEVVMLEPLYDSYLPIVRRAGAVVKLVRMVPPHWELPREELAAAFTDRTKLFVLNSPMNPGGKVFSVDELTFIASLLERHNAYAVCDEVYEHLVFGGQKHVPLMTIPGMRERCLRIGSAGKTFSLTGWKVGYITAARALLHPVVMAHQFVTYTTPPNLQRAVAYGLGKDDAYFAGLASDLERKRDLLADGLNALGFKVFPAAGTYFICADLKSIGYNGDDEEFCRRLTTEVGVAAIPVSAFYASKPPTDFIRFAFCKEEATLREALSRLRNGLRKI